MDVLILKRNNGYTAKEILDQRKTQPSSLSTGSCSSVLGIWDSWWNHWAPEGMSSPVSPALLPVTLIAFLLVIFTLCLQLSSVDVQRFCHLQHPTISITTSALPSQLYSLSSWGLLGGTVLWKDRATHCWLQWCPVSLAPFMPAKLVSLWQHSNLVTFLGWSLAPWTIATFDSLCANHRKFWLWDPSVAFSV